MRFAPQRRALFRHYNFQKWSDVAVLCTFWLGNVLRATAACNFSFLIWPAGSAPAALASLLFDPLEPQIIGKRQGLATFVPFRVPISSFFWFFSYLIFSLLLFSSFWLFLSLLFICPYWRKFDFDFKFPSNTKIKREASALSAYKSRKKCYILSIFWYMCPNL